ncbi:uncharacterized protein LOC104898992 [Beta vulgaris subsp. vulgaris]|uniref:uncharacterized protein LOC104898992 n=1 Tax=Beta vulgaris subsp. vulgaris TaxID=3555 RepID=UPI00054025B6|nr:uncharacterized protein LOC104898992 [Beta vulgaris subsp. vulgaris]
MGRWCVPNDLELKKKILEEAHCTPYSVHPGCDKLYKDLKANFWWPCMMREVAEFVARCLFDSILMDFVMGLPRAFGGKNVVWVIVDRLTKVAWLISMKNTWSMEEGFCTKLKLSTAFHAATDGQTERAIQTLEDMLRACALEFQESWLKSLNLVEFSYKKSYHASIQRAPYEALYGRKCRSPTCWSDISDSLVLGPDLIQDTVEQVKVIQARMKAAQDRQKSYADLHRKPISYAVGYRVLLKVSPMKGVARFGQKGKLSLKYVGPYEILERIGEVAYRLAMPPELSRVQYVFHVSQLRRYRIDPSHVIPIESIAIEPNMTFEERPVQILDCQNRALRRKVIPLVKVLWRSQKYEEATWEKEESMRLKYPELFVPGISLLF